MTPPPPGDAVHLALSDATRRAILAALAAGPRSAGELGAPFPISAPAVSQHLALLREAGLVEVERVGRHRVYSLRPDPLLAAADWMRSLAEAWERRLDRLGTTLDRLAAEDDHDR